MPPPPRTPRLASIDPDRLAVETVEAVAGRMMRHSAQLSPWTVRLDRPSPAAKCKLAKAVRALCAWAQRGEGTIHEASELMDTVARAVMPAPLHPFTDDGMELDAALNFLFDASVSTEIGVVLLAAYARRVLGEGDRYQFIRPKELAALASLSTFQVRNLIRDETIDTDEDGEIVAASVIRWLRSRGVPGFRSHKLGA